MPLVTLIPLKTNSTSTTPSVNFHYILLLTVTKIWPYPKDTGSLAALWRGGRVSSHQFHFPANKGARGVSSLPASPHHFHNRTFPPSFKALLTVNGLLLSASCCHWPWPPPAEDAPHLSLHINSHHCPETNCWGQLLRHPNLSQTLSWWFQMTFYSTFIYTFQGHNWTVTSMAPPLKN